MNRVKEFRKELGISQLELAKDIGVSRQTINMIENDKYNPTLELCLNLARSLQTDLNSLFWEEDFKKRSKLMKKETFTEKLIKRTYGISGPLDEYKRREADRIGNQVFIILFYLMIFGNLIPLLLAYKYPQEVALIYPPLILVIALITAGYVTYQMKKTGITAIDPDMLSEKESKQLHYPGLKAGLFFGLWMFFITPLLRILIGEGQDYFHSLLTIRNGVSSILGSIFFGASIQFLISRRIAKTKKNQDED